MSEEQDQSPVPEQPRQVPGKAKSAKSKEAQEQALTARRSQSIWPFALAVALMVVLMGLITHPIVFGIGLLLAAAAILGELKHQYRLGYDPPPGPPRFRRVEVLSTRKGVLVKTRSGYVPRT